MANLQMGLVARKLGMTQIFNDDGEVVPVTVLEVTPNTVLQVKTPTGKDGYSAVEIRLAPAEAGGFQLGQKVGVADLFAAGGFVDVTGTSKGKGFAGVMKRHNFKGFINSHGNHEYFRHGGSIGTRLTPGMTLKGVRMPGQMGNQRVTVQNIKVAAVDAEKNLLFIKGGVPGPTGTTVLVRRAVKATVRAAHKAAKRK